MAHGSSRAERKLHAQVKREEPYCQIRLPGCTDLTEVVDHIRPWAHYPELRMVRSNLQGACSFCNGRKSDHEGPALDALYGDDGPRRPPALDFFD